MLSSSLSHEVYTNVRMAVFWSCSLTLSFVNDSANQYIELFMYISWSEFLYNFSYTFFSVFIHSNIEKHAKAFKPCNSACCLAYVQQLEKCVVSASHPQPPNTIHQHLLLTQLFMLASLSWVNYNLYWELNPDNAYQGQILAIEPPRAHEIEALVNLWSKSVFYII